MGYVSLSASCFTRLLLDDLEHWEESIATFNRQLLHTHTRLWFGCMKGLHVLRKNDWGVESVSH